MTVSELKRFVSSNDKVPFILEQLGCHHIQYHAGKNYYSCANVDGDNKNAINVFNTEFLTVINYTRDLTKIDAYPDIITLVKYFKNTGFRESIQWIHDILGLKMTYSTQKVDTKDTNPLSIFKSLNRYKKNTTEYKILNNDILLDYFPYPHIDFGKEGIFKPTIDKFQLGYSYNCNRTIIPIRHWLTGDLIGIIGRTSIPNHDLWGIPKYFPLKPYQKSGNVYGLWEHYQDIQDKKICVVYEAQKSVLKRDSLGDNTGVAVCGHDISQEQATILSGLNLQEIVIAFDKDVSRNELRAQCEKFYGLRRVSYIYDTCDLLGEKDAPCDKGYKIYDKLFEDRILYDENEHNEYLKYLSDLRLQRKARS